MEGAFARILKVLVETFWGLKQTKIHPHFTCKTSKMMMSSKPLFGSVFRVFSPISPVIFGHSSLILPGGFAPRPPPNFGKVWIKPSGGPCGRPLFQHQDDWGASPPNPPRLRFVRLANCSNSLVFLGFASKSLGFASFLYLSFSDERKAVRQIEDLLGFFCKMSI